MSKRFTWVIDTGLTAASLPNAIGGYQAHVTVPSVTLQYNNAAVNGAGYSTYTAGSCTYGVWSEIYVPTDGNGAAALQSLGTDNVGNVLAGRVYVLVHVDVMNFTAIQNAIWAMNGSAPSFQTNYSMSINSPQWKLYRV